MPKVLVGQLSAGGAQCDAYTGEGSETRVGSPQWLGRSFSRQHTGAERFPVKQERGPVGSPRLKMGEGQ